MTTQGTIYSAIPKAMAQIKRLAKDARNADQKYDFASVDDFLAMTGPIMAEHGLFITMDEERVEAFERQGKYGPSHWLSITFLITVWHESGEHMAPARRTVEVIRTGAQSFGSAQSYALKQFQRALFCIPTGDKDDADFAERGDGPAVREPTPRRDAAPPPPPPPPLDPAAARDRIVKALTEAQSGDDLARILAAEKLDLTRLKDEDTPKRLECDHAYKTAAARIKAASMPAEEPAQEPAE
jgi:hypothetical protein